MKMIKVQKGRLAPKQLAEVLDELMAGEVVMHPTETCYGLAVDIFNQAALGKLYALKKMFLDKPVSMMVASLEEAQKYAEFNDIALRLAEKFWPGPMTLVLPRKKSLPEFFNSGHETVGVRCPDSVISQQLIQAYGGLLSTTSANISGLPEVYGVEDYLQQIKETGLEPALIVDAGVLVENPPSTLVGFEAGRPKILREGSLVKEVKAVLAKGAKGVKASLDR